MNQDRFSDGPYTSGLPDNAAVVDKKLGRAYTGIEERSVNAVCSWMNEAHAAGRKAERERNWKTVADLCGVNPWDNRPCIAKVEKMFWCPVCKCADKIRGGQDAE